MNEMEMAGGSVVLVLLHYLGLDLYPLNRCSLNLVLKIHFNTILSQLYYYCFPVSNMSIEEGITSNKSRRQWTSICAPKETPLICHLVLNKEVPCIGYNTLIFYFIFEQQVS